MARTMNNRNRVIPSLPKREKRWTRNAEKMREYIETIPREVPLLGDGDRTWNWERYPFVRMELDNPTAITLYQPSEGQIGVLIVEPISAQYIFFVSHEGYQILDTDSYPATFTEKSIITILFENGQFHINVGEYT